MTMSAIRSALVLLFRNRLAGLGAIVLSLVLIICLLAPVLPIHDPDVTAPANRLD